MKDNFKFLGGFSFKSIIINIIISLSIFLIFVAVIEIVLRTTHLFGARVSWSEPDTMLGYRIIPNSKYWFHEENDHPITGKNNSYGWRDKEWALKKPQNTYRIAVLGDSMVEAQQVESDSTFLTLTERQLDENHKLKVELMNFGRSGFAQTEELWVLENRVEQFSPDMVIVFFNPPTDIGDISRETAISVLRPFSTFSEKEKLTLDTSFVNSREFKYKCFNQWFKKHSIVISFISMRYTLYKKQSAFKKKISRTPVINSFLSLCTSNPDATYLKNYQLNKTLIKAMAEYCKDKKIKFMLVTIDIDAYIPEVEKKHKSIDTTFNTNYFEDDMKNYAASLNIEHLGLQRIFRKAYENTGVSLHWGHWNYEGHKIVANALSVKLKAVIAPFEEW